jgi:hypothetical protein
VYAGVARAYFFAGGEEKAEDYLAHCIHVDTLYAPAYVLRGDMALSKRDTVEAARCSRRLPPSSPPSPRVICATWNSWPRATCRPHSRCSTA